MVRFRIRYSILGLSLLAACAALAACAKAAPAETRRAAPTAAPVADAPPAVTRVEITAHGFEPHRVFVAADHPVVFRRVTNESCATTLVFPEFDIERALPLNTDVSVPLPDSAEGELAFQCGVGKERGKLFARIAG